MDKAEKLITEVERELHLQGVKDNLEVKAEEVYKAITDIIGTDQEKTGFLLFIADRTDRAATVMGSRVAGMTPEEIARGIAKLMDNIPEVRLFLAATLMSEHFGNK